MKGEEHILVNFPIDTSLKKKVHSALFIIPLHLVQCPLGLSSPCRIALKTSVGSGFSLSSAADVRTLPVLHLVVRRILLQDDLKVHIVTHL